jgi:hypothetical protein
VNERRIQEQKSGLGNSIMRSSATQGHVAQACTDCGHQTGNEALSGAEACGLLRVWPTSGRLEAQRRKAQASPGFTGARSWAGGGQRADRGAVGYIGQGDQDRTIAGSKKNGSASAGCAEVRSNPLEGTGSVADALTVGIPSARAQAVAGLLGDNESSDVPSTLE